MDSLIHLVHQAVAAFKKKDYEESIVLIDKAYEYADAMEYTAMDAQIFNALYDAYEMLSLIAELGVFEKNAFLKESLKNYKETLEAFTSGEGGTVAALQLASKNFVELVRAMAVAVHYLRRKKWRITDFPPMISFEFTSNGQIRLYAWQVGQANQAGDVETLRTEFEALFAKEQKSEAYFLDTVEQLFQNQDYQSAIQLLQEAMQEHESIKAEAFLRIGLAYMELGDAEQALDRLMKARVLGLSKQRIKEVGSKACQKLIRQAETQEERSKWTKLLQDFF